MSKLPKVTFDIIDKKAIDYGSQNPHISSYIAFRAGATEWATRAEEHLIPALEWIKTYGPCTNGLTAKFIDNAIAKYREVNNEQPK